MDSTASDRKGTKIQNDISRFYANIFLFKTSKKAEFKNRDDSEVLRSDFPGLRTFATSMTSTASTTSVASMTSTASFHQKVYSTSSLDHP